MSPVFVRSLASMACRCGVDSEVSPRNGGHGYSERAKLDRARYPERSQRACRAISASIDTGALDNDCLQSGRVDGVTLVEIDGTNRLAGQTRVEEPSRILRLGPFWKRQPHGVLEDLAYADDAVVGPDGHPLRAGGFLPLHLFDHSGVGAPDQSPQLAQPLTPPAGGLPDDVIDLLGRGCVVHAGALLRRLSTQQIHSLRAREV